MQDQSGTFLPRMLRRQYHQPFTGMQLTIQLHISGESQPILIDNAAVRWSGSAGIGLEFLTVSPLHQDRLNHMIQRLIQQLQLKIGP